MLTNQHRFVRQIMNMPERKTYKTYMCGLCHSLGDDYSLPFRILTNHEMILLNMLTEAQCNKLPENVQRRCPLNPRLMVNTNQTVASKFSAALVVLLTRVSIEDDLHDNKGLKFHTSILNKLFQKPANKASAILQELEFNVAGLIQLQDQQIYAESVGNEITPTAEASANIFAMTAQLAGMPQNKQALGAIGASYGAYVYLFDAFEDLAQDYVDKQFNPLHPFVTILDKGVLLGVEGITWLLEQFQKILTTIQDLFPQLTLYRYGDTLQRLLCQPIEQIVQRLTIIKTQEKKLRFVSHSPFDILKSALFIAEYEEQQYVETWEEVETEKPKRKRRSRPYDDCCDSNTSSSSTYCYLTDCSGCDCDGNDNNFDCIPCGDGDCDGNPCDGGDSCDCSPGGGDCSS